MIVFSEVVPAGIFLYAAYWAFEIRKALASPLRRNMAFWQGALSVFVVPAVFLTYSNNFVISIVIVAFYIFLFGVVFAYLDSLVKVARRSDPLLRNIIFWEKTRYVGWTGVVLIAIFNVLTVTLPSAQANLAGEFVSIFILVPFVVGGVGVLIGATRIKDPFLKGNLKWLGFVMVSFIVTDVMSTVASAVGLSNYDIYYTYFALIGTPVGMLGGYCLYRAARSLAPISRFTLEQRSAE